MRIFPEKIKRALKSTLFGLMLAASVTVQSLGAQALGTDSTAAKGAQKTADEASQQDSQQNEETCDIIGEAEL